MWFNILVLITALTISGVAAYYSIIGLTAIFAAAFWPIIIMGSVLEVGKIVTSVWLKKYWHRASWQLKSYLTFAVAVLMLITSMGIFGFLSKAHLDQAVPTGDVAAKVNILDERIKTERENIEAARKALQQLDAQVNERLSRSGDEKGAERAVQIRRQQAKEREKLQQEIAQGQKAIAKLNEERAPIASELRKVEAEVGPIKYVAALIYGDDPEANLLERAVRWVIIIIVLVFDPLAIALILAANSSMRWFEEDKNSPKPQTVAEENYGDCPKCQTPLAMAPGIGPFCPNKECEVMDDILLHTPSDTAEIQANNANVNNQLESQEIQANNVSILEQHPYLSKPWAWANCNIAIVPNPPITSNVDQTIESNTVQTTPVYANIKEEVKERLLNFFINDENKESVPVSADSEPIVEVKETYSRGDKVIPKVPETAPRHKVEMVSPPEALNVRRKSNLVADNVDAAPIKTSFGTQFPEIADKGDMFLRVDYYPNKAFKFNGQNWIEVDKTKTDSYAYDDNYIQFLVEKLSKGEYELDQLSAAEQELVEKKLIQISNDQSKNINTPTNT